MRQHNRSHPTRPSSLIRPDRTAPRPLMEPLESRQYLNGVIYSLNTLVAFDSLNGANPVALISDADGNLYGATAFGGTLKKGEIFKIDAATSALTILHSFTGTLDGAAPYAALTLDAANHLLYGTTYGGGAKNLGTIFKIDTDTNTFTSLYSFTGLADGELPHGSLTLNSGLLYGTTSVTKNPAHYGTVFKFDPATPTLTTLHTFIKTDGSTPVSNVIFDAAGDILGVTPAGGKFNRGTLFEIAAGTGAFSNLYSFVGPLDGGRPVGNLTTDAAGNIYGSTSTLGAHNGGTLFTIPAGATTAATTTLTPTILAALPAGTGPNSPHGALTVDSSGNIFGTSYFGGTKNLGTVFELPFGSASFTTLHSFLGGNEGSHPATGIIRDGGGNIISTAPYSGQFSHGTVFALVPTVPGAPTHFAFTTQPPTSISTQPFASPVVVQLLDSTNALVASSTSNVTLAIASGPVGATLSGTVTVAAVGGVATFNDLRLSLPGTYTLRASSGLLTTAISSSFTASPVHLVFTTQPAATMTNQPFPAPVVLRFFDSSNAPINADTSNVTLTIASGPAGATINGGASVTVAAVGGIATFGSLAVSAPGNYTLRASDGLAATTVSAKFTVPAHFALTTQPPANIFAGQAFPAPVVVRYLDSTNALISAFTSNVTVSIATGPVGAALVGTTTVAAVGGIATFAGLRVSKPGTYTLRVSDGLITSIVSTSIVAAPAHLAITTQPPANVSTLPFPSPVVIRFFDATNTLIPGFTSNVTLSIKTGPAGAVLSGTLTVAAIGGIATFSDLTLSLPGTYTLLASDGVLTAIITNSFVVT